MKVAIILPAFNEEGKIGEVVRKIRSAEIENSIVADIIVVDDGSTDGTFEAAKNAGATTIIRHPHNKGVGAAIRSGIACATRNNAQAIVIMGGDNQDDPCEIPEFMDKLSQGYDFVQGSRYLVGESLNRPPLFRRLTTKAFTYAMRVATGFPFTDASNGFRAFKPHILKGIDISDRSLDRYQLETYLTIEAAKKFRVVEIPVKKFYPKEYSKMKKIVDWWRISAPIWREIWRKTLRKTMSITGGTDAVSND